MRPLLGTTHRSLKRIVCALTAIGLQLSAQQSVAQDSETFGNSVDTIKSYANSEAAKRGIFLGSRDHLLFSQANADLLCEWRGFKKAIAFSCRHVDGRCGYRSPGNNALWQWNGEEFLALRARTNNRWLSSITCSVRVQQCKDGIDNDGDGVADKNDPGCWANRNDSSTYQPSRRDEGAATTQCQDGIDNDQDSQVDMQDLGCLGESRNPDSYDKTRNNEAAAGFECVDGIDNDHDGVTDANDPGCWNDSSDSTTYDLSRDDEVAATTQCQDGIDNNGDGAIDAYASDLVVALGTQTGSQFAEDTNMHSRVTREYSGAQGPWYDTPVNGAQPPTLVFSDLRPGQRIQVSDVQGSWAARVINGINDLPQSCYTNGFVSYTDSSQNLIALHPLPVIADQGLLVPEGATELYVHVLDAPGSYFDNSGYRGDFAPCTAIFTRYQEPACRDGIDNDSDGAIDMSDSGCKDVGDFSEIPHDPRCKGPTDNSEIAECSNGLDDDEDGVSDKADPGCWRDPSDAHTYDASHDNEATATTQCQDGIDNDGDGSTDAFSSDIVSLLPLKSDTQPTDNKELYTGVTRTYSGAQGPWYDTYTNGAKPPTLVFSDLKPGQLVYASAVQGAWSARVLNGNDDIPQSCYTNGYVSYTDSDRNLIALHPLTVLAGQGLMVPAGATELHVHVLDAPGYYFDNSGNRGTFDPCSATFTRYQVPACRDGIDNDGDGATDSSDLGCKDTGDRSEMSDDSGCTGPTDNSETT